MGRWGARPERHLIAMPPRFLRTLIYGRGKKLRDYERVCLDAVAGALPLEARDLMPRQLEELWLIQRWLDDKVTSLNLEELDDAALFRNRDLELRIARVKLRAEDLPPVTATLVISRGRLSSLHFDRSPKPFRRSDVRAERVDVLADPMAVSDPAPEPVPGPVEIPGLPFAASDALPPRAPEEVTRFLSGLGTVTPPDYAELLARTDGFVAGRWEFNGTRVWLLPGDFTYIVAAEHLEAGAKLCFEEGTEHGEVVVYDALDHEVRGRYASFVDALRDAG